MIRVKVDIEKYLIYADILETGKDLVITVGGGESHIGAVGISFPTASIITGENSVTTSVITLPSHKEDIVAKIMSENIAKALNKKVVVVAGIHFDNLSKDDIDKILKGCRLLTDKIIEKLD